METQFRQPKQVSNVEVNKQSILRNFEYWYTYPCNCAVNYMSTIAIPVI